MDEYLEELKERYIQRGCKDYRLSTFEDLKKIHFLKDGYYKQIAGHEDLTEADKEMFNKFLVNFYNAHGLEAREDINPIRVGYCKDRNGKEYMKFEYFYNARLEWVYVKNETIWW